jgi:hypothetical protein
MQSYTNIIASLAAGAGIGVIVYYFFGGNGKETFHAFCGSESCGCGTSEKEKSKLDVHDIGDAKHGRGGGTEFGGKHAHLHPVTCTTPTHRKHHKRTDRDEIFNPSEFDYERFSEREKRDHIRQDNNLSI